MQTVEQYSSRSMGRLTSCVVCRTSLPLRLPSKDEQGEDWACVQCGTTYLALMDEAALPALHANVRRLTVAPAAELSPAAPSLDSITRLAYQPRGIARMALPGRSGIICPWETVISRRLDEEIQEEAELTAVAQGPPFAQLIQPPASIVYAEQNVTNFVEMFEQSSALLERVYLAAKAGRLANLPSTEAIAQDGLARIAQDRDLLVALGINPPPSEAPSRHGLHVAMLAMSIGATMGFDDRTLVELGIGCLVHDIGMLRVERSGFQANRILGATDFKEIAKHPLYTFDLLKQQLDWLPRSARMVAYQMHERCNGSGYPRGRTSRKIHDLAKVAAVADVFLALASPRPHRPGLMPYYALERILHGVKDGLFDPAAARAFVKTVSLFPVGSYVRLSDGRIGKVLRTHADDYSRPVVAAWRPDQDETQAEVVELANESELRVVAAATGSESVPAG